MIVGTNKKYPRPTGVSRAGKKSRQKNAPYPPANARPLFCRATALGVLHWNSFILKVQFNTYLFYLDLSVLLFRIQLLVCRIFLFRTFAPAMRDETLDTKKNEKESRPKNAPYTHVNTRPAFLPGHPLGVLINCISFLHLISLL